MSAVSRTCSLTAMRRVAGRCCCFSSVGDGWRELGAHFLIYRWDEYTVTISLRHPSFGAGSLSDLQSAYATKVTPGRKIQLVDDNGEADTRTHKLVETNIQDGKAKVQMVGKWPHRPRIVCGSKIVGGWPVFTSDASTTSVREMQQHISFIWPGDIEDVAFIKEPLGFNTGQQSGQHFHNETNLEELIRTAQEHRLAISIDGTSYPLHFGGHFDPDSDQIEDLMPFEREQGGSTIPNGMSSIAYFSAILPVVLMMAFGR